MKALVVERPLEFAIQERDIPKPTAGQVLVRILAAGICGSDLHAYQGHLPVVTFPRVLGHEMVGEIVEAGADVADRKPGDHVVIEPAVDCGTCYSCRIGYPHNCCSLEFRGIHIDGGSQEYMALPEDKVYPVPRDMPFATAVLAEPLGIGLEAAKTARLIPGDTVAILGAGPIGLSCSPVNQYVARPPEMSNTPPVENEQSSEDSQATIAATSDTRTNRPIGILESM